MSVVDMDIKAAADLKVVPKGSQIGIFTLLISGVGFFALSCWLYMSSEPYDLPLVGAGVLIGLGILLWLLAHRNESLNQAHPTVIDLGDGERKVVVSSDGRSVPALNYIRELLSHYQATFHREPLPPASGMINAQGQPISGSESSARDITDRANREGQQINNDLFDSVLTKLESVSNGSSSPVIAAVDGEPSKLSSCP